MLFANFGIHVRSRTKKGMHRNSLGFLAENFYAVKCVIFTSQITMHLNAFVGLAPSRPLGNLLAALRMVQHMFSSHSYLTTHNMTTIFKTDHTTLNSLIRMRILSDRHFIVRQLWLVLIVKLRSYNFNWLIAHCILFCQLYSYCEVAFWQLLLNEDCDCEEENRGIEECEDKEGTEGRLLLITQLSCLQPHIKTCIKQSQI